MNVGITKKTKQKIDEYILKLKLIIAEMEQLKSDDEDKNNIEHNETMDNQPH